MKKTIPLYGVKLPDGVAIIISRKPPCGRHIMHDIVYANRVLPQVNTPVRIAKSSSKKQELSWKVHDAFVYKKQPPQVRPLGMKSACGNSDLEN